jgi:hypothetical protein
MSNLKNYLKNTEAQICVKEGKTHLANNELEAALDNFYFAIKNEPKNMEAPYFMAKTFVKMELFNGAIKSIDLIYENVKRNY